MTTTVSITRPEPAEAYTIYGSKAAGTPSIRRHGIHWPGRRERHETLPPSRDVVGDEHTAATLDEGRLGLDLRLYATSEAAFQTLLADLAATIHQFSYTTTITINDSITTWTSWAGTLEPAGGREVFPDGSVLEEWNLTIPVYPIPTGGGS